MKQKLYYAITTEGTTDGYLFDTLSDMRQEYINNPLYTYNAEIDTYTSDATGESWAGEYGEIIVSEEFSTYDWNNDLTFSCPYSPDELSAGVMYFDFLSILKNITNLTKFANYSNIPLRTLEDWKARKRKPSQYVQELTIEKAYLFKKV